MTILGELINLSLCHYLVMQYLTAKSQECCVQDMEFYMVQRADVQEWITEKIRTVSDRCALSIEKMCTTVLFKGFQKL